MGSHVKREQLRLRFQPTLTHLIEILTSQRRDSRIFDILVRLKVRIGGTPGRAFDVHVNMSRSMTIVFQSHNPKTRALYHTRNHKHSTHPTDHKHSIMRGAHSS